MYIYQSSLNYVLTVNFAVWKLYLNKPGRKYLHRYYIDLYVIIHIKKIISTRIFNKIYYEINKDVLLYYIVITHLYLHLIETRQKYVSITLHT